MSGFPVHLCQPDATKSCAACCGIYNFVANEKRQVEQRLRRNTQALSALSQAPGDQIRRHSEHYRQLDNGSGKRFATLFNCEFAGFLDPARRQVGCLLHPLRHDGCDFRQSSFYGAELCAGHFCLSYHYLTEPEQRLVVNAVDDWYLYGLVITDIDLVKGLYDAVSNRLGAGMKPERARQPHLKTHLSAFFQLKTDWPLRSKSPDRFGKYRFTGEDYRDIRIPYERWHRRPSAYDRILVALGTEPSGPADLDRAEALIAAHLDAIVAAYETRTP